MERFQAPVGSDVINLGKYLPDIFVVLFMTVTQTLLPKYIGGVSESQISVLVGGELSAEILLEMDRDMEISTLCFFSLKSLSRTW